MGYPLRAPRARTRRTAWSLEEAVICVLANAAQIAQVSGRKTDVKERVSDINTVISHEPSCSQLLHEVATKTSRRTRKATATRRRAAG